MKKYYILCKYVLIYLVKYSNMIYQPNRYKLVIWLKLKNKVWLVNISRKWRYYYIERKFLNRRIGILLWLIINIRYFIIATSKEPIDYSKGLIINIRYFIILDSSEFALL